MNFTFANPPRPCAPRNNYDRLFTSLQDRPGKWARLDPDSAGRTPERQAIGLLNAASKRGLKIQTSKQEGHVYVRLLGTVKPHRAFRNGRVDSQCWTN